MSSALSMALLIALLCSSLLLPNFVVIAQEEDIQRLINYIDQLTAEKEQLNADNQQRLELQEQLQTRLEETASQLEVRNAEIATLQSLNHDASNSAAQQLSETVREVEQLRMELESVRTELEGSRAESAAHAAKAQQSAARGDELLATMRSWEELATQRERQLSDEESKLAEVRKAVHLAEQAQGALRAEVSQLRHLVDEQQHQLAAATEEHHQCRASSLQYGTEVGALQQQVRRLSAMERNPLRALGAFVRSILHSFLRLFGLARNPAA